MEERAAVDKGSEEFGIEDQGDSFSSGSRGEGEIVLPVEAQTPGRGFAERQERRGLVLKAESGVFFVKRVNEFLGGRRVEIAGRKKRVSRGVGGIDLGGMGKRGKLEGRVQFGSCGTSDHDGDVEPFAGEHLNDGGHFRE